MADSFFDSSGAELAKAERERRQAEQAELEAAHPGIGELLSRKVRRLGSDVSDAIRDASGAIQDAGYGILVDTFKKSADVDTLAQYDIVTPLRSYERTPYDAESLGKHVYAGKWERDNFANQGTGISGEVLYVSNEDLQAAKESSLVNTIDTNYMTDSFVNGLQRTVLRQAHELFPDQVPDSRPPAYGISAVDSARNTETVLRDVLDHIIPNAEQTPETEELALKVQIALSLPAFRQNLLETVADSDQIDDPNLASQYENDFTDETVSSFPQADPRGIEMMIGGTSR
ncbi:MAG: hypothetical protein KDI90_04420 [Alphaproteobacteria bacterium]|nr:hypothetical protein [Alphaproteobacteria bacterium]MCB9975428.1 hypothetical protein [Rhodospirillales bacterium]